VGVLAFVQAECKPRGMTPGSTIATLIRLLSHPLRGTPITSATPNRLAGQDVCCLDPGIEFLDVLAKPEFVGRHIGEESCGRSLPGPLGDAGAEQKLKEAPPPPLHHTHSAVRRASTPTVDKRTGPSKRLAFPASTCSQLNRKCTTGGSTRTRLLFPRRELAHCHLPPTMAADFPKHPFLLPVDEVAQVLGTDIDGGLSSAQVAELQKTYPPNELDVGGTIAWYTIFIRQLCNAMILVRINIFYLPLSLSLPSFSPS